MTSTFFKGTGTLFYRMSSIGASQFLSLMTQVLQFWQSSTEGMCPSQYITSGGTEASLSHLGHVKFNGLLEVVHDHDWFLHCKGIYTLYKIVNILSEEMCVTSMLPNTLSPNSVVLASIAVKMS